MSEHQFALESNKTLEQLQQDFEAALNDIKFGLIHKHDITQTIRSKGFEMDEQIYVYEVCNPGYATKVLAIDLSMNMALPCRVSIYTDNGKNIIGMINPTVALASISEDEDLKKIALEVEELLKKAIEKAH
jgi:uncharacterized protein (DUF302 family)